jgi:lysyl-tRNA synthetase class 1
MSKHVVATKKTHINERPIIQSDELAPYQELSFERIDAVAQSLAELIEDRFEMIASILLKYESFEVVRDETDRTLDLLRNLKENKQYFRLRINEITTFLPRNQPLYAFACFVLVPSLMAHRVHFRIPHSMRHFFSDLLQLLEIPNRFPNVTVSTLTRLEFLRERSALRMHSGGKESIPVTDVVIFTGTPNHAEQLRLIFDSRTLFILNGAGHNPVVVAKDANLEAAADAVLSLQLYNQGQDCAAPNTILVHADVFDPLLNILRQKLRGVRVGRYEDRSCRVGPISDPDDLVRIEEFLIHNSEWLDTTTRGTIHARDAIVEPTIICKPLSEGGNFTEIFAPIIFLQSYSDDVTLSQYFENPRYAQNAMYISVYGKSPYVSHLIDRSFGKKVLHDKASILINTHLHVRGMERGTKPYGGYGYGASSLTIGGKTICKPTLPQRDIYEHVVKPLMRKKTLIPHREFTTIMRKNVEKLLRLMPHDKAPEEEHRGIGYIDTHAIKLGKVHRYAEIDNKYTYHLLELPNIEYIAHMKPEDFELIRSLRKLLHRRFAVQLEEFSTLMYALASDAHDPEPEKRARQKKFFHHVYQLLFGTSDGPRLPQFLLDADITKVEKLLDL